MPTLSHYDIRLTATLQEKPGKPGIRMSPLLNLLELRTMEVVVTTGVVRRAKLQSNCHHRQTNIQFFLQAGCPSCRPTNSVKARKGNVSQTCSSQAHWGIPVLSLTIKGSWLFWGRVAKPSSALSSPVPQASFTDLRNLLFLTVLLQHCRK